MAMSLEEIVELLDHGMGFAGQLYRLRTQICRVSMHTVVERVNLFGYPLLPWEYELIEEGLLLSLDLKGLLGALVKALDLNAAQERWLLNGLTLDMLYAAFTSLADEQVANDLVESAVELLAWAASRECD